MPKTSLPRTDATPKQNEGHQRRNNCSAPLFRFTALDKGSGGFHFLMLLPNR